MFSNYHSENDFWPYYLGTNSPKNHPHHLKNGLTWFLNFRILWVRDKLFKYALQRTLEGQSGDRFWLHLCHSVVVWLWWVTSPLYELVPYLWGELYWLDIFISILFYTFYLPSLFYTYFSLLLHFISLSFLLVSDIQHNNLIFVESYFKRKINQILWLKTQGLLNKYVKPQTKY